MAKSNAGGIANRSAEYILIAIANTARASAIRNLALDFCPNVILLRDGQTAIEHLDRAGPPRLLITELSLPRVDGFGVLRHLRRTTAGARATAIVVSSHDSLRSAADEAGRLARHRADPPARYRALGAQACGRRCVEREGSGRRCAAPQRQDPRGRRKRRRSRKSSAARSWT